MTKGGGPDSQSPEWTLTALWKTQVKVDLDQERGPERRQETSKSNVDSREL